MFSNEYQEIIPGLCSNFLECIRGNFYIRGNNLDVKMDKFSFLRNLLYQILLELEEK